MKTLALFITLTLSAVAADVTITGKVVGVHDGDTLTLRTENKTLKVRLSGIDTPELGQPFGNNAKQALSALTFGKSVIIKSSGEDRYGRTLGYIFSNDQNINTMMVRMGMAWQYRRYEKMKREKKPRNTPGKTRLAYGPTRTQFHLGSGGKENASPT